MATLSLIDKLLKTKKLKVFLLDDNRLFLKALQIKLESAVSNKMEIHTFSSSDELFASMDQNPDVVVIDYHLDDRSSVEGQDLIKKLKHINNETHLILLTAEKNISVARECYNLGVCNYINKNNESFVSLVGEVQRKIDLAVSL